MTYHPPPPGYPIPGYVPPRPKNKLALISLIASVVSIKDGDNIARLGIKIGWISFGISWGIVVLVNLVGLISALAN